MKTITLSKGWKVKVDDGDFDYLSEFKWSALIKKGYIYAARGTRKKGEKYRKILMHRIIINANDNHCVDHINGDTLDNRKCNLRLATKSTNLRNSKLRSDSKCNYKGVQRRISKKGLIRYNARIQINKNVRLYLGWFKTELEAAIAYNDAASKYFGEFARLNKL